MSDGTLVRVGLIGCGRVSGHHGRSMALLPEVELVAVCDLDMNRAQSYADEFGARAYQDYRKMLTDHPEIDTVAIVTPSGMHFEHALEIVEKFQRHLIVEKPTFMNVDQLNQVYKAAEECARSVYPVFQNRHNLAVQRVKKGLINGELGALRVASVRVRWCRPQAYYDLAEWRGTFSMDGGCLTNQGIHHIDLLRFFGGEVAEVSARMKTLGAEVEVEDTVVGSAVFTSGALASLEVTTAARPDDFEASISLVCEQGVARIGGKAVNELELYTPDPEACASYSEDFTGSVYGNGHRILYEEILADRKNLQAFSVGREDNRKTIELLNAFYMANEQQAWVSVENAQSRLLGQSDDTLATLYRTPQRKK